MFNKKKIISRLKVEFSMWRYKRITESAFYKNTTKVSKNNI